MSNQEKFDYESFEAEALAHLRSGGQLEGKDGALAPLLKRLLEASLSGELDAHLAEEKALGKANRRNGKSRNVSRDKKYTNSGRM